MEKKHAKICKRFWGFSNTRSGFRDFCICYGGRALLFRYRRNGGTYYPIGSAIASIITKYVPGIEVTAESTGASVANSKMIREGKVELMMGASNTSFGGYSGQPPFENEPVENIRGIACLYPEIFQFVVLKGSNLKTAKDLAGKKVAVGAPGSGTERTAKMVLEAHGLDYDKFSPQFLNFGEAITALKDRLIDCAVIGSGIPTSAVVDASTTLDIQLLTLDADIMNEFLKERSYLAMINIPAGTYRVDEDVAVVASPALFVAREDLPGRHHYCNTFSSTISLLQTLTFRVK